MTFAREDQQLARDVKFVQRTIEQIIFQDGDPNVFRSGDHVRGRAYFVDLVERGLAAIAVRNFPRMATQKIDVVEAGVIVAPVSRMFHGRSVTAALNRVVS